MSRSDSWAGLSPRAQALVRGLRAKTYEEHAGLCNLFPLSAYRLRGGEEVREVVQDSVWAGGPTWFTTLERMDGTPLERVAWTEQEVADWMGFEYGEAEPTISAEESRQFEHGEESILAGRMVLHWSDERKFERWRAGRETPAEKRVGPREC